MKEFLGDDFLLDTDMARRLYHRYAQSMPIVDYHCHLSVQEIAQDRRFTDMAELWLSGDHYKWRLMRAAGVDERFITGDAPGEEKFAQWAGTLERAVGNPLYHWSHLELRRYFGYDGILNRRTAGEVWRLCSEKLEQQQISARSLISRSGVTLLCTTDDPADDLRWHRLIREDESFSVQVLPAFRPDAAMSWEKEDFASYLLRLGEAAESKIDSFAALKRALEKRADYFDRAGCRTADLSVDRACFTPAGEEELEKIFARVLAGGELLPGDREKIQSAFILLLSDICARRGWVMQLHYGCLRGADSRRSRLLGADTGFDCMGAGTQSHELAQLLDRLSQAGTLGKLVLYSLLPGENAGIDSVIGSFQGKASIQHGSAWWFNDHIRGIRDHLTGLASQGLLGNFIGMLTDSRSFLSYVRHEYFRRLLCGLIGQWAEAGECPGDEAYLGGLVQDICYNNAVRYFGFALEETAGGRENVHGCHE